MQALLRSSNFISLQRLTTSEGPDDSNLREALKTGPTCARGLAYQGDPHRGKEHLQERLNIQIRILIYHRSPSEKKKCNSYIKTLHFILKMFNCREAMVV